MPEDIYSWSTTAASNGAADGAINWAEGMARNAVNDSSRSEMAAVAKWRNLTNGSIVTAGAANAQTFTSGIGYSAATTGLLVKLKAGFSNTASMTLNMDSIGAVTVKDELAADLIGGEVVAGGRYEFIYDGTNWLLLQQPKREIAFNAYSSGGQVVPSATWTKITLAEQFDIGDGFDLPNSRFLPAIAGKYFVAGQLYDASAAPSAYLGVQLLVNAGLTVAQAFLPVQSAGGIIGCSTVVALDASSYVELYGYSTSGTIQGGLGLTFLSGHKVA